MNLHEYQAKTLLAKYGLPIPLGGTACTTSEEVLNAVKNIGGNKWVVKAQVHAGGRGKAGGVKLVDKYTEAKDFAKQWLGKNLVTFQTDASGQPVNCILVEPCTDIKRELYLGAVIDRSSQRIVFMASTEGGVDIEEIAQTNPEKILKATIDPLTGAQPYQARDIAFKLGLNQNQVKQFTHIFMNLAKMFAETDLSLLEINPLVVDANENLLCLDCKINIDGNALYRQKKIKEMHDPSQEDKREAHAANWDLNYVPLEGNIGCMVNGAGLAMGTMDIIKLYGGSPANFLDVGGSATRERVSEAFKIILSDENVNAVLVNIFGGIVRCDLIAEGIIGAIKEVGVTVPVVVRLEGNNSKIGSELLSQSGLNIIAAQTLIEAAEQVIKAAEER